MIDETVKRDKNMATLREIQLCELEILKEVRRICDKYKVHYWLAYGTMLGAVRHKGFIPWDDDLDIYMTRKEFRYFEKICKKELSKEFFLQTYKSDRCMPFLYAKVRKNGTVMINDEIEDGSQFNNGVWIDIFPLVSISNKESKRSVQVKCLRKIQANRCQRTRTKEEKNILKKICKKGINGYYDIMDVFLWLIIDWFGVCNSDNYVACGNVFFPNSNDIHIEKILYKKSIFKGEKYQFESEYFTGIENYDEYLTQEYGEDYMTPKRFNQHILDYDRVIL